MHRPFLKRASAVIAGLGLSTFGVLAMAPPAAAVPAELTTGTALDAGSTAPIVLRGLSGQSAPSITVTIPAAGKKDDFVEIQVKNSQNNCTPAGQPDQVIGWNAATSDTTKAALSLKPGCVGSGTNNILRLTLTEDLVAELTVHVNGIKYDVPAGTPTGRIRLKLSGVANKDGNATIGAVDRVAGNDRFATAGKIAAATAAGATQPPGPACADNVTVVSGLNFPDALSAASLGRPILMVNPTSIPEATTDAIKAMGVKDIIIVGGTEAVSSDVYSKLDAMTESKCSDPAGDQTSGGDMAVRRISGGNRYDTARAVVNDMKGSTGSTPLALNGGACKKTLILTTGEAFPDALAAGALATSGPLTGPCAVVGKHLPIVLTTPSALRPEADEAIRAVDPDQIIVVGGTTAVSEAVAGTGSDSALKKIKTTVEIVRVAGLTRQATAAALADEMADLGFNKEYIVASGVNFPDALAGASLGASRGAPILLTSSASALGQDARDFIHDGDALRASLLGGTTALADAVGASVADALKS